MGKKKKDTDPPRSIGKRKGISMQSNHVTFTASQLQRYVDGMQKVLSVCIGHLPDEGDMLRSAMRSVATMVLMMSKRGASVTVEYPRTLRKMISDVKLSLCDKHSLIIQLFRMWVRESTGAAVALRPFWDRRCEENSDKLWLPAETDSAGSHDSSKLFSNSIPSNSWFSIKQHAHDSHKTSCPSSTFSHAGKWGGAATKSSVTGTKKVRFVPTKDQQVQLKEWMGASRFMYNRTIHVIEKEKQKVNFQGIRNRLVPKKKLKKRDEWLLQTPKDIRAESIHNVITAYSSAFTNIKKGHIKRFHMRFRSKKHETSEWINIPKTSVAPTEDGKAMHVFKRYMKSPLTLKGDTLKSVDCDCKIHHNKETNRWYFLIPVKHSVTENQGTRKPIVSIDPGVKTFLTLYDPTGTVTKFAHDDMKNVIVPHYLKTDGLISVATKCKSKKTKRNLKLRIAIRREKLKNRVHDIHTRAAKHLVTNYDTVLIPDMGTSHMVKRMSGKTNRRTLLGWSHYQFIQRLTYYGQKHRCNVRVVTEEYTSKTCGVCGSLHPTLGNGDMYCCKKCGTCIDRDTNGARNILLKNME
jgi:IS605 OrfB family transposase